MKIVSYLVAQASSPAGGASGAEVTHPIGVINARLRENLDIFNHPAALVDIIQQINILWAIIFIVLGALCVLNGYRWHKGIVIAISALVGLWVGAVLGERVGDVAIVSACAAGLLAIVSWPLMKYSVALFGGLAGAFAGANVWTAIGMDPGMHEMGALIGLVVVGMLAFLAFRAVVIVLTSVVGGSILVFGSLAALSTIPSWEQMISNGLQDKPLVVPVIVASAAGIGAVIQAGGGIKGLNQLSDKADPAKAKRAQQKAAA